MMRWSNDWLLLPERFAIHEPTRTAVLADVHLGYSAARQRLGDAIPSRSVAEEMQPLVAAAQTHSVAQLIVAGDLFERRFDAAIFQSFREVLQRIGVAFLGLVPGNHDRGVEAIPLLFADGYDLAGWHVCHGDQPVSQPRAVLGHWHPAVRVKGRKLPCFLTKGTQLILPAFSLDAAGVDVGRDVRWRDWQRHGIADRTVNTMP